MSLSFGGLTSELGGGFSNSTSALHAFETGTLGLSWGGAGAVASGPAGGEWAPATALGKLPVQRTGMEGWARCIGAIWRWHSECSPRAAGPDASPTALPSGFLILYYVGVLKVLQQLGIYVPGKAPPVAGISSGALTAGAICSGIPEDRFYRTVGGGGARFGVQGM